MTVETPSSDENELLGAASTELANSDNPEPPREGTLAWLQTLDHVELDGLSLPSVHRVPEGSTFHPEHDGHCRLVKPTGERCRAPATRLYGLCVVHAGGGGAVDVIEMGRKGREAQMRLKARRQLLAIGPARSANPRQLLRLRAHERAETLADAMLAPLDDVELGSLAKQGAAKAVLDAAFPLQTVSVELELPSQPDEVDGMGWSAMRQLAASLLGEEPRPDYDLTPELNPASTQG